MRALRIAAGTISAIGGTALLCYGIGVLADYFGNSERDAPVPFIVGGVLVLFLLPGAALVYVGAQLVRGRPLSIRLPRG